MQAPRILPVTSIRPLTLKQVIDNINLSYLVGDPRKLNYEEDGCASEEIFVFCTVSSAFYSEIKLWFDDANER